MYLREMKEIMHMEQGTHKIIKRNYDSLPKQLWAIMAIALLGPEAWTTPETFPVSESATNKIKIQQTIN